MTHRPTAEFSTPTADLVYGVNEAGIVVPISEVPKGLACKCRCPACGKPLVAKKGKELTHHFAHDALQSCHGAPETALHRLAKQIVEQHLKLLLPEVKAVYGERSRVLYEEMEVSFDRAVVEARHLTEVIPDLYVEREGRMLLVEMFVTHACDDAKLAELRAKGIATLEIDLSRIARDAGPVEVEHAVLFEASRRWVYHPKIDAAVAAMREAERKVRQAAEEKAKKDADDLSDAYRKGLTDLAMRPTPRFKSDDFLFCAGLGDDIGINVDGAGCFTIGPKEWQFSILRHAFILPDRETGSYRTKALLDWFKKRNLIRPDFRYVSPELEEALEERQIGFLSPYRAIETYLDELVRRGVLEKANGYCLSSDVVSRIIGIHAVDTKREDRRDTVLAIASKILGSLPEDERNVIAASDWLSVRQDCGISFNEAIDKDDVRFRQMNVVLQGIDAMLFRDGPIVESTLSLPIAAELERLRNRRKVEADAREAARVEAARLASEARRQRLAEACSALEPEGQAWSRLPNPRLGARIPVEMALAGEPELMEALGELNREARERKARLEREQFLHDLNYELEKGAARILGDAARPFLGSPFPELGRKKPREYCVCQNTLKQCLDLAEKVRRGTGRINRGV